MTVTVLHRENGSKGEFYVDKNNENIAEMTYSWAGDDKFIIDHTWVDDSLRGQSGGRHLLDAAVSFAREKGVKIIPLCPFAKSVFDKDQSIHDVLN
jgi:uncharacterized protein